MRTSSDTERSWRAAMTLSIGVGHLIQAAMRRLNWPKRNTRRSGGHRSTARTPGDPRKTINAAMIGTRPCGPRLRRHYRIATPSRRQQHRLVSGGCVCPATDRLPPPGSFRPSLISVMLIAYTPVHGSRVAQPPPKSAQGCRGIVERWVGSGKLSCAIARAATPLPRRAGRTATRPRRAARRSPAPSR